ncbi:unnamed protein product [Prunus armeniaca]|uniref:Uncharacterized protein n=1 Tax=Prunus armeniaca TaxID=36596 RepID=A0A6J5X7I2_PRUAR|nr:unnamed protein product [Prunus armeniaca]
MEGEEIKGGGAGSMRLWGMREKRLVSMRLRGNEGEEIKGGGEEGGWGVWFYEAMGECGRRNQGRGVDSGFCGLGGIGEKKLEGGGGEWVMVYASAG